LFWLLLVSLELAQAFHGYVFKAAGFSRDLLDLSVFNPFGFGENQVLLLVLILAAVVSVIPIRLALRKPIGEVLG
tara:strand:- start:158 stop:382 length:225 start_codon:yes stop_codon:yes gene_type:complete